MYFTFAEAAPGTTTKALLRRKAPAETQRASSDQQYLRQLETQLAMFDVTSPESIPRLVEFLKTGTPINWRDSGEVWKYAAAQALFLIDTAQSRESLRHYMVDPLYDFDFSIQCARDWGMERHLLNSFIRQYHLSGTHNEAAIELGVSEIDGRRNAFRFVIRITNTSTTTRRFYRAPAHLGMHVLLLSDMGDVGHREGLNIKFGEIAPDILFPAVAPGKSLELEFTGYLEANGTIGFQREKAPFVFLCGDIRRRDFDRIGQLEDQSLFRHGAGAWDTLHALDRDGVYDAYAVYRSGSLPKAPFDNIWTGRLVSKPVRINLQAPEREPTAPANLRKAPVAEP